MTKEPTLEQSIDQLYSAFKQAHQATPPKVNIPDDQRKAITQVLELVEDRLLYGTYEEMLFAEKLGSIIRGLDAYWEANDMTTRALLELASAPTFNH